MAINRNFQELKGLSLILEVVMDARRFFKLGPKKKGVFLHPPSGKRIFFELPAMFSPLI